MRQIGRIQVPEEFLKECVQNAANAFLIHQVMGIDEPETQLDPDDPLRKDFEATNLTYNGDLQKQEFIVALIRTQLEDWVSYDDEIMNSMDFQAIRHEIQLLGKQMAFERITPDTALMALASEFQQDKNPPMPL